MQSFRLWGSGNNLSSWEQCYAVYMRILLVSLLLMTAGCSREPQSIDPERLELYTEIYAGADMTPAVQEKWARSCALCHAAGVGGAPRVGVKADWQARIKKGPGMLMVNTIDGINQMPPLGYCQDCGLDDFAAMIKFMIGDAG